MGDPKFIIQAISLESLFIGLTFVSIKKIRYALIPNIVIGIIVMIGNSISSQHIEIMSSMTPLGNAIVLILGGYVLQSMLILASLVTLIKKMNH